jgi:hypothetical protein
MADIDVGIYLQRELAAESLVLHLKSVVAAPVFWWNTEDL